MRSRGHPQLLAISRGLGLPLSPHSSRFPAVPSLSQCFASSCCEAGLSSSSPVGSTLGLGVWYFYNVSFIYKPKRNKLSNKIILKLFKTVKLHMLRVIFHSLYSLFSLFYFYNNLRESSFLHSCKPDLALYRMTKSTDNYLSIFVLSISYFVHCLFSLVYRPTCAKLRKISV